MKTLGAILGLYFSIGWVVGLVALVRSQAQPYYMLEDLSPIKSAAAAVVFWPLILLAEWDLERMRRRLREGPIRTDWVTREYQIPKSWIKDRVATRPQDFDWNTAGLTPEDNPGVKELLDMMVVGDELRQFRSDVDSWRRLSGRAGYVLLRGGQQVAHLTTIMN